MGKEEDKHPKEPFNMAAEENEISIVFESDMDDSLKEDEEPLRSNTDPKHDPANVKNPSLTPSGMGSYFPPPRAQVQGQTLSQSGNIEQPLSDEEWQHLLRNGDHTFEEEFNGLRVRAWMADEPSKDGIHGGHIQRMVVTEGEYGNETELAQFKDGDWEKRPEATPERQAIIEATQEYDGGFLKERRQKEEQERARQREIETSKDQGKTR